MSDTILLHNQIQGLHSTIRTLQDLNRRLTEQLERASNAQAALQEARAEVNRLTGIVEANALVVAYTNTRSNT